MRFDSDVIFFRIGMLASAATVSLIAESLRKYNISKSVIDPVGHTANPSIPRFEMLKR